MEKTKLMLEFEQETGKQSAIVKFSVGGQALEMKSYPKLGPYDYNTEYLAWLEAKANISDEAIKEFQKIIRNQCDEISALKAQLTWRPVSEELPSVEKDGTAIMASYKDVDKGLVSFDCVSTMWFLNNYKIWFTHWLPIPPAPEGE